jgi:hypothetical protein
MHILNVPVISTGHITDSDAILLARLAAERPQRAGVAHDEYSFWVWIPEREADDETATRDDLAIGERGLSSSFVKVMHWARANGFTYVRLDQDGDLVEDALAAGALDRHEW